MLSTPIHPAVPLFLHPGVNPPRLAAAREALSALYRAYGALEDERQRRGAPVTDAQMEGTLGQVEQCLGELRRFRAAPDVIRRVELGRELVLGRWKEDATCNGTN